MSNISMEIEFVAGTTIESAVTEAKQKVSEWNVGSIHFEFNGVKVYVGEDSDLSNIENKWHEVLKNKKSTVFY